MINLTSTPAGFASWQAKNGATGQTLAQDHDGVSNGVEYFLGGPNGNTTGFTPLPPLISRPLARHLRPDRGKPGRRRHGHNRL